MRNKVKKQQQQIKVIKRISDCNCYWAEWGFACFIKCFQFEK